MKKEGLIKFGGVVLKRLESCHWWHVLLVVLPPLKNLHHVYPSHSSYIFYYNETTLLCLFLREDLIL